MNRAPRYTPCVANAGPDLSAEWCRPGRRGIRRRRRCRYSALARKSCIVANEARYVPRWPGDERSSAVRLPQSKQTWPVRLFICRRCQRAGLVEEGGYERAGRVERPRSGDDEQVKILHVMRGPIRFTTDKA